MVGTAAAAAATWPMGGHDLGSTRNQASEKTIGTGNAARLAPRFVVDTTTSDGAGDVSATPVVDGDRVSIPDSAGNLGAVSRMIGATVWRTRIADRGRALRGRAPRRRLRLLGPGSVSVANNVVYAFSLGWLGNTMVAMNAASDAVLWRHAPGSSCLGGAAIVDGTVYWGTGYRSFAPLTTAGHSLFAFAPAKA